jgi:hypothetical protein
MEPTGVEGGRSGSWHGAVFRQGRSVRDARERSAGEPGLLGEGSDFVRDPQQHEAPLHFGPQWQDFACEAASNGAATDTLDARASSTRRQASTSTTAGKGRRCPGQLGRWRIDARTGDVAALVSGQVEGLMIEADRTAVKGRGATVPH